MSAPTRIASPAASRRSAARPVPRDALRRAIRSAGLAVLACGCTLGSPGPTRADQQAIASCKAEADRTYLEQNREVLSERSQTDTPFSSSGMVGVTSQGLGQLYGRSNDIEACLRSRTAANAATEPAAGTGVSPQMDPAGASQP